MLHPARRIPLATLLTNLQKELEQKTVYRVSQGNLDLYCYTNRCVYNELWNSTTLLARGLIIERTTSSLVATPFPKFFNLGERKLTLPPENFSVTEKLDGSLIIVFYHDNHWQTATKGAFASSQAQKAQRLLQALHQNFLIPGATYLFEYIAPDNQIVVKYDREQLILLSAYDSAGQEFFYRELQALAENLGTSVVRQRFYPDFQLLIKETERLDQSLEGFVIQFPDGLRLKLKGKEYRRIHQLLAGITPNGLWQSLRDGADLEAIRQSIPEEYWSDWDNILTDLEAQWQQLLAQVEEYHQKYQNYSDKELGLILQTLPDLPRKFLFPRRQQGHNWHSHPKQRYALLNFIRPVSDCLQVP